MSTNNVSPATFIGGTWERIQDRFLLSAGNTYSAGSTGGKATHTHRYGIEFTPFWGDLVGDNDGAINLFHYTDSANYTVGQASVWSYQKNTIRNENTAYSQSDITAATRRKYANVQYSSNLPPYLAVYMWKRTA